MSIYGRRSAGLTAFEISSDTKRVSYVQVPDSGRLLSKVSVLMDGFGAGVSGIGAQATRAVIYDSADSLVASSDEVVIAAKQPAGWQDFFFSGESGKVAVPQGLVSVGLHGGGVYSDVARVYGDDPHGSGGRQNADTYADGPSPVFGAATVLSADMSIFVTASQAYANLVPAEPDLYLSRLPWAQAQARFALAGPIPGSGRVVKVGWHGGGYDAEVGAVALVSQTGAFAYLAGERIKLTPQDVPSPRSAYVYVYALDANDLDWDVSLSRKAFSRIGVLAADTLTCLCEVIG